jgi:hypothetical protein
LKRPAPRGRRSVRGSKQLLDLGWHRLLDKWFAYLTAWEFQEGGLISWGGERALTGLLNAAAWRVGGQALEEYRGNRRGIADPAVAGPARGDLWLCFERMSRRETRRFLRSGDRRWWIAARKAKGFTIETKLHRGKGVLSTTLRAVDRIHFPVRRRTA